VRGIAIVKATKRKFNVKKALEELQDNFAMEDLDSEPTIYINGHPIIKLLVKKLLPIRLRMDKSGNHKRAHLHVDYGIELHAASYAIDTGDRLAGTLDTKYDRYVRTWIKDNRAHLIELWNDLHADKDTKQLVRRLLGAI
jgi:hypothetical protein